MAQSAEDDEIVRKLRLQNRARRARKVEYTGEELPTLSRHDGASMSIRNGLV